METLRSYIESGCRGVEDSVECGPVSSAAPTKDPTSASRKGLRRAPRTCLPAHDVQIFHLLVSLVMPKLNETGLHGGAMGGKLVASQWLDVRFGDDAANKVRGCTKCALCQCQRCSAADMRRNDKMPNPA
eukprot:366490-Chlamydomonas_euryale.AAC.3